MLLNTRNFLLYLLCVAFLVIAIAMTATAKPSSDDSPIEEMVPTPAAISNEATVIGAVGLDRQTRLLEMREKVAALIDSVIAIPDTPEAEPESLADPATVASSSTPDVFTEQRCETYAPFAGSWQASGLSFTVVEGARLLSRITPSGEESVLQLPLRAFPLPVKSCLPTDVVAIALDGSLIRNNEIALYSIFSEETLLGYTIDGFPLYGVSERPTDECGGRIEGGQYQYYLQPDTSYILGCFVGIPIEL